MGVVQAIKLMRSTVVGDVPALPMAQIAVNLADKKIFIGKDGTIGNAIHFVDVGGVASMISTAAYSHPADGGGSIETALSGANVISKIIVNASGHVTGTDTRELVPSDIGAAPINHTMYIGTTGLALNRGTGAVALEGITSIDGSAAKLTTPRELTIGSTAKNFDGSAAVSWSLADINTHLNTIAGLTTQGLLKRTSTKWTIDTTSYLPLAGGTLTGTLTTMLLQPSAHATYDIGITGTRYRHLYLSGDINAGGNVLIEGDLTVTGTTITANVSTMLVEDPVITLGGTTAPTVADAFDRGIEFHWYSGSAKKGFFGFDMDTQKFTFIPDATNNNEVFEGDVGTIVANFEGALTGNASTATKVNNAVTFNNSGSGATSPITFDGSTARIISYNTIGAAALAGSTNQNFSTKNLSVSGTLGVTGNTTLPGGLFDSSTSAITFSYGVGITSGALTLEGKETMETPYIDFFHYDGTGGYSRIIEEATKELSIYGGASADGKIKLKSDTYAEKALYIGGDSGAKLVYVAASGNTPAFLKLENYDGGIMHLVTTGGVTMYSTGTPSGGSSGGATVILNGATTEDPTFWAPETAGSSGQYLTSSGGGAPVWTTIPTATSLVAGIMKLGASGGAATYDHDHTFASLTVKPNTLAGYGIGDAVHSSHEGAGAGAHAVANANLNGFMSGTDKTNLDNMYANLVIYNAGQASGRTLALASGLIPAYFYNKRNVMLMFGDGNEQHVYIWIATTNLIEGNKDTPANWLRISKPDVDGGTY